MQMRTFVMLKMAWLRFEGKMDCPILDLSLVSKVQKRCFNSKCVKDCMPFFNNQILFFTGNLHIPTYGFSFYFCFYRESVDHNTGFNYSY